MRNLAISVLAVFLMLFIVPAFLPLSEPVNPGKGAGFRLTTLGWIYVAVLACVIIGLFEGMKE